MKVYKAHTITDLVKTIKKLAEQGAITGDEEWYGWDDQSITIDINATEETISIDPNDGDSIV